MKLYAPINMYEYVYLENLFTKKVKTFAVFFKCPVYTLMTEFWSECHKCLQILEFLFIYINVNSYFYFSLQLKISSIKYHHVQFKWYNKKYSIWKMLLLQGRYLWIFQMELWQKAFCHLFFLSSSHPSVSLLSIVLLSTNLPVD